MGMLDNYMVQLSQELGTKEPIAPNEDQSYLLSLDPKLLIIIREDPQIGAMHFFSKLTSCPTHKLELFFLKSMEANLFGKETGGSVIGLDKDEKVITFSHLLLPPYDYKNFRDRIEDFVNYAEAWREETVNFEANKE